MVLARGCKPVTEGQSSANETPVPDGNVVLHKRGNEVAALVLHNQSINPTGTDGFCGAG
jgi:hypothetical protein